MTNVVCKLRDIIEVVDLSQCVSIGMSGWSIQQRLVVRKHVECTAFHKVTKMLNCQVDCQQFMVKITVPGFCQFQFP